MSGSSKVPIDVTKRIADEFLSAVRPFCERAEIAGSIRRGKEKVGDVEIVVAPRTRTVPGLFGPMEENALLAFPWGEWGKLERNGERYKRIMTPEGIAIDVFIVLPPAQFGLIYLIRTGPGEFSQWVVTPRRKGGGLPSYLKVRDGAIWHGNEIVPTPTEEDVFRVLGIDYIPPSERKAFWGVIELEGRG